MRKNIDWIQLRGAAAAAQLTTQEGNAREIRDTPNVNGEQHATRIAKAVTPYHIEMRTHKINDRYAHATRKIPSQT